MGILERESVRKETRKCSAAQGPHSEVVPRAFWSLVSKSCDERKGSFARGCEAKRWSHWTCSSLRTIFQPMRINSVPDVKYFCNNKNVLCVQSMVWHFLRHPARCPPFYKLVCWLSAVVSFDCLWHLSHFPWTTAFIRTFATSILWSYNFNGMIKWYDISCVTL
jgi:hypothetical protein